MHGAGNDFIVLDATAMPIELHSAAYRQLADRHFGIGADQILIVGPSPAPGIDFSYRIINADGSEVEQCGNGARCFMRFIHEKKLTTKTRSKFARLLAILFCRWMMQGTSPSIWGPLFLSLIEFRLHQAICSPLLTAHGSSGLCP